MTDEPARLKDLLGGATKKLGVKAPIETARIWSQWRRIVGEAVAAHAEPTSLKNGILRVRADSPAWATEISYLAADIRSQINTALGSSLVQRVDVWTGPKPRGQKVSGDAGAVAERGDPVSHKPSAEARKVDPETAFERARKAWSRAARKGPKSGLRNARENPEKPR